METKRVIVVPGWLTATQAAAMLGRSVEAFRQLARYHKVVPAYLEHTVLYAEADIRRLADRVARRA